jgi:tRNA 2-thiocytidine biosynthesis protein TtcA
LMKLTKAEYFISKKMGRAVYDYGMIAQGDKVLVGVSGGKDSLTLLRLLTRWQETAPFAFQVKAAHVLMEEHQQDTEKVLDYLTLHHFDSFLVKAPPAPGLHRNPCYWCARRRREALFKAAGEFGYNKIALAHHLDDIVETMLMNLFFHGEVSTMTPLRDFFAGALQIIRPFAYVKEDDLRRVARMSSYPTLNPCPHEEKSQRTRVKGLIRDMERHCRPLKINIFRSLEKIRKGYLPEGDFTKQG